MKDYGIHPCRRLKFVATINDDTLRNDMDPEYELQYIDIGNVDSSGRINDTVTYRFAKAPSRARRRVRDGDVIISCVRTYLQAIAAIQDPPPNLVVSTGFAVVRPLVHALDRELLKYVLREASFLAEVKKRSVGVSYPAITAAALRDIPVHVPPRGSQAAIANHVDREIAKMDAIVTEHERILGFLEDRRHAIIARAVTRGLNPDAPLRHSGIPWLGEIPEHWDTERARWLFTERDERSATGEEELLTVSHLTGVTPRSQKNVNMFKAATTEGYKICIAGDLVVNTMWAWMGAMGIAPMDGIVSPAYNVYEPRARLYPGYAAALTRLPVFAQEAARHSKGVWSSRLRLYPQEFFAISLPVPPLAEQREIASYVDRSTAKLAELRAAMQATMALIKERRVALIAAAVSGDLNVEGEA